MLCDGSLFAQHHALLALYVLVHLMNTRKLAKLPRQSRFSTLCNEFGLVSPHCAVQVFRVSYHLCALAQARTLAAATRLATLREPCFAKLAKAV